MGYSWRNIAAAPTADDNGYVTSVDMKVGTAYTLAATAPAYGARHVTVIRTVAGNADTPGTLTIIGTNLAGQSITESIVVGAHGVTVTGTKFFAGITSITGVGWVVDVGTTTKDTIIVGWDALNAVAVGTGVFHGIVINTTAAGTITITDANGAIATIASNAAVVFYGPYDVDFSGYLRVETAAASNITVLYDVTSSLTYAMA